MKMKAEIKGADEALEMFDKMIMEQDNILTETMKAGGGKAADYMRSEINALKTTDEKGKPKTRYAYPHEKEALQKSMGYTPVRRDGEIYDIKVGFDGYSDRKTKSHPTGVPNQLIANSINAGTSFMQRQPFINRTKNKGKTSIEEAMKEEFDKQVKTIGGI